MRSASFCLVKGQETQLISKQEVKIAANTLLLSTWKPWIVFTLAQGQSGVETLKYSGDKQEVGAFVCTRPADKALISPQLLTDQLRGFYTSACSKILAQDPSWPNYVEFFWF